MLARTLAPVATMVLTLLAPFAGAVPTVPDPRAPIGWLLGVPTHEHVIPAEGVVGLAISGPADQGVSPNVFQVEYVEIDVVDAEGDVVAGDVTWRADIDTTIWRSAAPLTPGARYVFTVQVEPPPYGGQGYHGTFVGVAAESAWPPVASAPSPTAVQVSADCGGDACCRPRLEIARGEALARPVDRYVEITFIDHDGATPSLTTGIGTGFAAAHTYAAFSDADLCYEIAAVGLVDGSRATALQCVPQPSLAALGLHDGPCGASGDGCGAARGPAPALPLALALLAWLALRRRGHRSAVGTALILVLCAPAALATADTRDEDAMNAPDTADAPSVDTSEDDPDGFGIEAPPRSWVATLPSGEVVAPREGIFAVSAAPSFASATADLSGFITFEVRDAVGGALVPGDVARDGVLELVIWRSRAPLPPGARYDVEIELRSPDGFDTIATTFTAVTADDAWPPVRTAATVDRIQGRRVCDEVCCKVAFEVSGPPIAGFALVDRYVTTYLPDDDGAFEARAHPVGRRFLDQRVVSIGPGEEWCFDVVTVSLIDDSTAQSTICAPAPTSDAAASLPFTGFPDATAGSFDGGDSTGSATRLCGAAAGRADGCQGGGSPYDAGSAALLALLVFALRRRSRVHAALLVAVGASVVVVTASAPARAEVFVGDGDVAPRDAWTATLPFGELTIPREGVIAFFARTDNDWAWSASDPLDHITVLVVDADGDAVAGAVTYDEPIDTVVWRADAPLTDGAAYEITVLLQAPPGGFGEDLESTFRGVAASAPWPPIRSAPVISAAAFSTLCGDVCCTPSLELSGSALGGSGLVDRYAVVEPVDDDGTLLESRFSLATFLFARVDYPAFTRGERCVELVSVGLVDGSTASSVLCVPEPDLATLELDDRPCVRDPETGAVHAVRVIRTGDGAGCGVASTPTPRDPLLFAIVGLLLAAGARRRLRR